MRQLLAATGALAIVGSALAQDGRDAAPSAKLRRPQVVIVGASVSAGFADPTSKGPDGEVNRAYRLDEALKKTIWPRAEVRLHNYANLTMFMAPERFGERQVVAAKKREPDLVIGVDFLAWFGYGARRDPRAGEKTVDKVRLAQLEKGLQLLADFTCPLVVGDFPDMRNASTHMLPPHMIPNLPTQKALNARLAKWAKSKKNVLVFPIAKFALEATTKAQAYPWGEGQRVVFPKNFLLQSDRLHATRVGSLVIIYRMAQSFPQLLPKDHRLLRPGITIKGLVEQAGLVDLVPDPQPVKAGAEQRDARSGGAGKRPTP